MTPYRKLCLEKQKRINDLEKQLSRQEAMHHANLKAYEKTMVEMDRLREALEEIQDERKRKLQVSNYHMCVKTLLVRTVQALNGTEEAQDD